MTIRRPSVVTALVRARAKFAGDIERNERLIAALQSDTAVLRQKLASADAMLVHYDQRIDPKRIPALNSWEGKYGKRGALKEAVLQVLQEASPEPLRTIEVAVHVIKRLGLHIETDKELALWMKASLGRALRRELQAGTVERLHSRHDTNDMGSWRRRG